METNVENDSAVGDSEVFKPSSSIRRTMCPPRNRMSLEYELYSVPSQELPVGSEESFTLLNWVLVNIFHVQALFFWLPMQYGV